jgi:hypothetical protein
LTDSIGKKKGYPLFFSTPENPWTEDPDKPAKAATVPLLDLARFADQNVSFCKANGITSLAANARALATLVQENRDVYISQRKMFVVRIPELQVALETMLKLPAGTDLIPLREEIKSAIDDLAEIERTWSRSKRTQAITKAVTGLELSRPNQLPALAETQPTAKAGGILGKLNVGAFTSALDVVQSTASSVKSTSLAYASLATVVGKRTLLDGVDMVTMPVRARATALRAAIEEGTGVALVGGLLATVLFPPALPLAIGYAYLTAGDRYFEALDETLSQQEQERKLRERGASDEVAKALAAVRGQRVIRLESKHLLAEVDLTTNQIDGTILSGRYSGSRLSELSVETIRSLHKTAPDGDTKKLLIQYLDSKQV